MCKCECGFIRICVYISGVSQAVSFIAEASDAHLSVQMPEALRQSTMVAMHVGSLTTSIRYTPLTMLLCLDSWSVFTGRYENHGVLLCMWSSLICFIWSGIPLPDALGRALSSIVLVLWGHTMGHPMRFLHLVSLLELCYPTFDRWPKSRSVTLYSAAMVVIRRAVGRVRSLVK